jgi:hypothetical protein
MDRAIQKTLKLFTGGDAVRLPRRRKGRPTLRQLIQRESEIGGKLFGPVPRGHHRQFFNLDESTWVWYEEWQDEKGKKQSSTARYELHENGILKIQDKTPYYFLDGSELKNFMTAIRLYYEQVSTEVYNRDPATGNHLAVS